MKIKSLHIYPVKSLSGIDINSAEVRPRGLSGDRRFMLVRKGGGFVSQRQNPRLAEIKTRLLPDGIALTIPNQAEFYISYPKTDKRIKVTLWRDRFSCVFVDHPVNPALSAFLGEQIALVYMDKNTIRQADENWAKGQFPVSFADGYPVLITNQASLGALNTYLVQHGDCPLPMNRFRPNIVIDSTMPWAENRWQVLRIGEVKIKLVKPCARCVVTSINQENGKPGKKSALAALKVLNPSQDPENPGVIFGQNGVVIQPGRIVNGQSVEVIL